MIQEITSWLGQFFSLFLLNIMFAVMMLEVIYVEEEVVAVIWLGRNG